MDMEWRRTLIKVWNFSLIKAWNFSSEGWLVAFVVTYISQTLIMQVVTVASHVLAPNVHCTAQIQFYHTAWCNLLLLLAQWKRCFPYHYHGCVSSTAVFLSMCDSPQRSFCPSLAVGSAMTSLVLPALAHHMVLLLKSNLPLKWLAALALPCCTTNLPTWALSSFEKKVVYLLFSWVHDCSLAFWSIAFCAALLSEATAAPASPVSSLVGRFWFGTNHSYLQLYKHMALARRAWSI